MKQAGIDVMRIVWSAEYEPLHVGPSADAPGYVRVFTSSKEEEEFWGKVDVTMPAEMARMLAKAIDCCATEQEQEKS